MRIDALRNAPRLLYRSGFPIALFLAGLVVVVEGASYPLGSARQLGPGFFPVVLGALMCSLAGWLIVAALRHSDPLRPPPYRPFIVMTAGIIAWALLIERAGLIPATFVLIACVAFAEQKIRLLEMCILALVLAGGGVVVFIWGFGLPFAAFGTR